MHFLWNWTVMGVNNLESTLVQIMAWCRRAASLYMCQCWPWSMSLGHNRLSHWGIVTHICVDKLTIIGSDNSLSPGRRQAIIWTNAGILLIEPLRTNFNEISIAIHTFPFKEIHLKMSSGKWRPFCLGLNVLCTEIHWLCFQACVKNLSGLKYDS